MTRAMMWAVFALWGFGGLAGAQEPPPSREQAGTAPPAAAPAPTAAPSGPPVKLSPEVLRVSERVVILSLQTFMLGEQTYANSNGGFFGGIGCLTEPWKCIPGYPADGANFVDATHNWLENLSGYSRKFYPGPHASVAEIASTKAAPDSLKTYAYTATALQPGNGLHGLCADSKRRLCMSDDGREPPVKDGLCEPCKKFQ